MVHSKSERKLKNNRFVCFICLTFLVDIFVMISAVNILTISCRGIKNIVHSVQNMLQ